MYIRVNHVFSLIFFFSLIILGHFILYTDI